jgi:WD40 repeat protein
MKQLSHNYTATGSHGLWIVFGNRKLSILSGGLADDWRQHSIRVAPNGTDSCTTAEPYMLVSDWIWDARLMETKQQQQPCCCYQAAIAMASNMVEIWSLIPSLATTDSIHGSNKNMQFDATSLYRVSEIKCITYCMSFYGWHPEEEHASHFPQTNTQQLTDSYQHPLLVASGSCFAEIIVWKILLISKPSLEEIENMGCTTNTNTVIVQQIQRIQGHHGAIFSIKWNCCTITQQKQQQQQEQNEWYIASTSDDRTVRLWKMIHTNSCSTFQQVRCGFGHTARVWDVAFLKQKNAESDYYDCQNFTTIASVGEEGIVRVWNVGNCSDRNNSTSLDVVTTFRGHYDGLKMCLWKIATITIGNTSYLAVGGNDGCVKLYSLFQPLQCTHSGLVSDTGHGLGKGDCITKIELRVPIHHDQKAVLPSICNTDFPATGCQSSDTPPGNVTSLTSPSDNKLTGTPSSILQNENEFTVYKEEATTVMYKKEALQLAQKRETKIHSICSVQFCPTDPNCIVVSCKSGALWSYHFNAASPNNGFWEQKLSWWPSPGDPEVSSFPQDACCMSIHPNGKLIAFGSTRGDLALVPLLPSQSEHPFYVGQKPAEIKSAMRLAIQGLYWINEQTLIIFHIKGVISLWTMSMESSNTHSSLKLSRVLDMETIGVPISFTFEECNQLLFVGDTRGTIAMFDVGRPLKIKTDSATHCPLPCYEKAAGKILKAHKKEHVTAMTVLSMNDNRHFRLLSVGFDGYLTESYVFINSDMTSLQIQKGFSRPISCFSSLSHVSVVKERIIIGGFQGVNFSLWDVTNGFELFSVKSGGRQRRHIFSLDQKSLGDKAPIKWSLLALCASSTASRNDQKRSLCHDIHVYFPSYYGVYQTIDTTPMPCRLETFKNFGTSLHAETINSVCWVTTFTPEINLLLSGSKDGTVNLSLYKNCKFVDFLTRLPSHESAVKAVCSSHHPGKKTSLLVTAGGKMVMNFYRLEELEAVFDGGQPFSLHFLCCHRSNVTAAIDHRINAVKSFPINEECGHKSLHLVVAGDSNGCLHVFIVSEYSCCPIISKKTISEHGRPILCMDGFHGGLHDIFVVTGNSAGEVNVWHICYRDLILSEPMYQLKVQDGLSTDFSVELLCTYQAHQMGTNDLSALIVTQSDKTFITICSGGDDQAIVVCTLEVITVASNPGDFSRKVVVLGIVKDHQNESCLRAVKARKNRRRLYLYAVGYDQKLTVWCFSFCFSNSKTGVLKRISQYNLNVFDAASMDCTETTYSCKSTSLLFAVSGEGLETITIDDAVFEASLALLRANYFLICAGSGLSADSGLETYECMPELYREFCEPFSLLQNEDAFQNFWLKMARKYKDTLPHEGYHILEKWCGGSLPGLLQQSETSSSNLDSLPSWWVYTSNVDGHFLQFERFRQHTCQVHGNCNEFRCSSAIGLDNGRSRLGPVWAQWNEKVKSARTKKCANEVYTAVTKSDSSLNRLKCIHCGLPIRPNILMFHDTDENVLSSIRDQCQQYQSWEQRMEDDVIQNGRTLVILELGCGLNVPIIRKESEEVIRDCIKRTVIHKTVGLSAEFTLIRVNLKDAGFDPTDVILNDHVLSIYDTSINALKQIDQCLTMIK